MTVSAWLAVDAGGTSTRCAVVAEDGTCVGFARVGGGNPISHGLAAAAASLGESARRALSSAGIRPDDVGGAVVAMAGIALDASLERSIADAFGAAGVHAPIRIESDAQAAFASGGGGRSGYVLISGTGAAALRVEDGVTTATADGLGWLLGDVGSGFWIGRRVVVAALEDLDGRGPATALTPLVLSRLGLEDARRGDGHGGRSGAVSELLVHIYRSPAIALAQFAALAFAGEGDAVADGIVADAGAGLADTLLAVRSPHVDGAVVATGGVLAGQERLRAHVEASMSQRGHPIAFRVVPDGLEGAVALALAQAGVAVDDAVRRRIHSTLGRLRDA